MNIRRHPLEELQDFIIVDGVWAAQLLGEFVHAFGRKIMLIHRGGMLGDDVLLSAGEKKCSLV